MNSNLTDRLESDMQKINILGIGLTDHSLKESLVILDGYVRNGGLNTILYVTTPMLIKAGSDEEEKNSIESMDMTLCGDADILRVAKIDSAGRLYEVENRVFFKEFLRRLVRGGRKVYLLDDSEEDMALLKAQLESYQRGILIGGSDLLTESDEDMEEIINRINDVAPTAIISRISSGRQEKCMARFKALINAGVWLGISKDMALGTGKESLRKRAADKVYRMIFRRRVNHFKDENGE